MCECHISEVRHATAVYSVFVYAGVRCAYIDLYTTHICVRVCAWTYAVMRWRILLMYRKELEPSVIMYYIA